MMTRSFSSAEANRTKRVAAGVTRSPAPREVNAVKPYEEYLGEILISSEQLQARIAELGRQISADYAGKDLLLVCILKGGVLFLSDLMRQITIPHAINF